MAPPSSCHRKPTGKQKSSISKKQTSKQKRNIKSKPTSKHNTKASTATKRSTWATRYKGDTSLAAKKARLTVPRSKFSNLDISDTQSSSSNELDESTPDHDDVKLQEDKDHWADKPKPTLSRLSHHTQQAKPQKLKITDVNLDTTTINSLLSASGWQTHNQIPTAVQTELKNLRFMYQREKKLLSLDAHCSEGTINKFLQSFLKYSKESANTAMPSRNTQDGFTERNQHLGQTWTNFEPNEKYISAMSIFFPLGYLPSGWGQPPAEPNTLPLDDKEKVKYVLISKQLVDLDKVTRDLGQDKFGPHLPTAWQYKGIEAIEHIGHKVI
ncbi:hypothetical protein DFH28DRAFT_935861 [Melampsora americana]|nr:hypothetical protein DFH28DRAFT_935861 [Melampsora americana]